MTESMILVDLATLTFIDGGLDLGCTSFVFQGTTIIYCGPAVDLSGPVRP